MTPNQQLRELMESYGLTQVQVVSLLNKQYFISIKGTLSEPIQYEAKLQTVKSWLASPEANYYRPMPDIALELIKLQIQ